MKPKNKDYVSSRTSVHFIGYHFVWCPKYHKSVLVGEVAKELDYLIRKKAEELGCTVLALEVMPNHVHLSVQAKPTLSPSYIIGQIKGYTSRNIRRDFEVWLPSLWTRSYFVSSHGHVSKEKIREYIESQWEKWK